MNASRREVTRQLVHFGVGLLALALPLIDRWIACSVAAAAVAGNLWLLPRLPGCRQLFRSAQKQILA